MVVHHRCQMVGGEAVGFDQNLVVGLGGIHFHVPPDDVVEAENPVVRHFQANDVGFIIGQAGLHLLFGKGQAAAVVFHELAFALLFFAHLGKGFRSAETAVGMAGIQQPLCLPVIEFQAFALHVGAKIPADAGTFVYLYAQAAQGRDEVFHRAFHQAVAVGVLDAEDEGSAAVACEKVIVKGGAEAADV